jgi:hypothetical protein
MTETALPQVAAALSESVREPAPGSSAAPLVVADSENERPKVVGIRQEGGQYKGKLNSDLCVWAGEGGAPSERGAFKNVAYYGCLDVTDEKGRVRYFFGHGDTILFRLRDAEAKGVCLGFAQKVGKAYEVIVSMLEDPGVMLVPRERFCRLDASEPPADSVETKQLLAEFLAAKHTKAGMSKTWCV